MTRHTGHRERLTISTMRTSDIPFAVSLTDREGWGFFRKDFETRLKLYPTGAFVARFNNEPAGIISSVQYGQFAFLGNLIVDHLYRGRGIGSRLMQHAVGYLRKRRVRTIELDGVLAAVSMYRRLGFRDKHLSLRLSREPHDAIGVHINSSTPVASILAFDRTATGLVRQRLLRAALNDKSNCLHHRGNPVSAYALVRERAGGFFMIAPLVASHWRHVPPLVEQIIQSHGHRPLWFGVPEPHYQMSQLLTAFGFCYTEPSLRMYYGRRIDYEKNVYGIFGPAVG